MEEVSSAIEESPAAVDPVVAAGDPPAEALATKPNMGPVVSKEPKARKPRSAPSHPPYYEMIGEAIAVLKERTGSSQYAIAKYMEDKHKAHLPNNFRKLLLLQIKKFVGSGKLVKVKNSYKLPAKSPSAAGAPAKPKPKPTAAAKPKSKPATAAKPKLKPATAAKTKLKRATAAKPKSKPKGTALAKAKAKASPAKPKPKPKPNTVAKVAKSKPKQKPAKTLAKSAVGGKAGAGRKRVAPAVKAPAAKRARSVGKAAARKAPAKAKK